ncbi:MAG TPA: type IV pilus secretin PilQ [Oligoflexia bacterium]|mgnify:CR=1 FL=1|nr:type IV pilus secretin PilQ [Oligoflexia bacterium]HMP27417.1 type IV pilus secretin PilQ [Oligoflexia bacterium]
MYYSTAPDLCSAMHLSRVSYLKKNIPLLCFLLVTLGAFSLSACAPSNAKRNLVKEDPSSRFTVTTSGDPLAEQIVLEQMAQGKSSEQDLANKPPMDIDQLSSTQDGVAKTSATEPTLVQAETKTPENLLTSIALNLLPAGENSLSVDLNNRALYRLVRSAPSEYILRLSSTTFDPATVPAILAPPNSGIIKSARPVRSGDEALIRIFVDPAKNLVARQENHKIILVAEPKQLFDSGRAQPNVPDMINRVGSGLERAGATGAAKATGTSDQQSDEEELASGIYSDVNGKAYTGRLISLDLQDTDIENALRIIAEVSNLNIISSPEVKGKVTLRLIDVPWDQALDVILKTNGLDKVQEGNVVRIASMEKLKAERESLKQLKITQQDLEELLVRYVRISYARASDLKSLVESVMTERGSVSYDERTNQLILKDVSSGIRNGLDLISRIDLRTPQVLLETQIVEANRSFLRDLGSELGFNFVQSVQTGNPTGYNFPNSVGIGGGIAGADAGAGANIASFPAAVGATAGSAVEFLFGSADGTMDLRFRLSALERDGKARIISRPSVATTNNKQASIKSVEKVRVKVPQGGVSVATGQGATAAGGATQATETIEIGITLDVTPQASPDYYVLLDIRAKSSTLGATVVDGIPSEIERSATSSVLVSSGQTFAMGGIYKTNERSSIDGVPFFKDIPFLGHLFRRNVADNTNEELLFFLTPRIVEGSFDDATMKGGYNYTGKIS